MDGSSPFAVHFAFSYDEEVGCFGVRELIADMKEQNVKPLACIIGEPTNMVPAIAHKGVYRYRWHNLPLYVPPGHGLVYLFGLTAGATPIFKRHGRRAAYVVLAACAAWAVAGLTVLPLLTHRWDLQGAACLPLFAFAILRSPRYALFATIFLATTDLELAGTLFGDWAWVPAAPWTHLPSGNPPSAIAGGYCVIDGSVALVMGLLLRLRVLRAPQPATAAPAAAAA